jgi:hypothetical protein
MGEVAVDELAANERGVSNVRPPEIAFDEDTVPKRSRAYIAVKKTDIGKRRVGVVRAVNFFPIGQLSSK